VKQAEKGLSLANRKKGSPGPTAATDDRNANSVLLDKPDFQEIQEIYFVSCFK
jgi:hypothetical protein